MDVILSFPPAKVAGPESYDRQVIAYLNKLEKLPAAAWGSTKDGKSPLELLDPSVNSIPYLNILSMSTKQPTKDKKQLGDLLNQLIEYWTAFDPVQVRYVGQLWREMWVWASGCFDHLGIVDLSPLAAALLRLDPTAGTFTSMHLRFVRQCLANGTPSQALTILDRDIFAIPHSNARNVPQESPSEESDLSNTYITERSSFSEKLRSDVLLEYYLLGAHVYIGIRNWPRARLFLETVMMHPAQNHATSELQVEAFQKWTLVGLLTEGKTYTYPRTIDPATMKALKSMSRAYEALVDSFEKRDWRKFHAELDSGQQVWAEAGNSGLVAEVAQAMMQYRISDLQKTYAALPVGRVALYLSLTADETLMTLKHMIQNSSLDATLTSGTNAADAVLRFNLGASSRGQSSVDLEAQTKRIELLIAAVRDADRRLELTKEHIDITKRNKRSGTDAEMADQMDLTWDTPSGPAGTSMIDEDDAEEDIMA